MSEWKVLVGLKNAIFEKKVTSVLATVTEKWEEEKQITKKEIEKWEMKNVATSKALSLRFHAFQHSTGIVLNFVFFKRKYNFKNNFKLLFNVKEIF